MKQTFGLVVVVLAGFLASSLVAAAEESPKPVASPLEPVAFFTAHEWDAKLPDSPDGKKMSIHARFTWSENKQAIRISNYFVIDGKQTPYIDGLYAWNPEKRAIIFVYSDAKGGLYEGTVRLEDGKLVHEFQEIHPDGKIDLLLARVTPHGTDSWDNAIFGRKEGALTPLVQVQYLPTR
jgi:dipeptidyl aminopeptidase/acylaminoacyl peptidase